MNIRPHTPLIPSDSPAAEAPRTSAVAAWTEAAFTLVDTLIALVLVMIVGLGAGQLVLGSVEVVRDSDFTTTASMLAMEKIEELRQLDFDDGELDAGDYSEDSVAGFPEFTRTWLIEDDQPRDGLKRITVTVSALWGSRGQPRSASAVTYRAGTEYGASFQ